MGDMRSKRWLVTYTKHLQQKRKIYQDGFLLFHPDSNKLELYDDCQTLLGVKIAKKDDIISSGETLTFSAYLVDIGDLEGNSRPVPNLNNQLRDNKVMEKKAGLLRPKKKFNPVFAGFGKNGASSSSLSPSQKIIEEFKKNEILKYGGGPRNSPDATKASYTEWQVLYTTQKTQKAKKYHDGFLRIAASGSQGRQAKLYDLNRELLDSKFLKKDEVVESGQSLIFIGHLVDVGESEADHKPQPDLKFQTNISFTNGRTELLQRQQTANRLESGNVASSCTTPDLSAAKNTRREWHALYTNQITQKTKKYHSGFLTLVSSGSFQLQTTLLAEDGTVLSRKFLKLSENVKSGSSFQLSNYLVEVGEPREIHPEGEPPKHSFTERDEKSTSCPSADSSQPKHYPLNVGEAPKSDLCGKKVKSMLHPSVGSPIYKPLSGGEPPKYGLSEKESKSTLYSTVDSTILGKNDLVDKPLRGANDILSILRKSTMKQNSLTSDNVLSQFQNHLERGADDQSMGVLISEGSKFQGKPQCKYSSLSKFSAGEELYDFPDLNPYGVHTSKSTLKPFSSENHPQVKPEPQDNRSNGHAKAFIESMFAEDATTCLRDELPGVLNTKALAQPGEEREVDLGKRSFEVCNNSSEMDDIPSFDLGF